MSPWAPKPVRRRYRVALAGYYGFGNLGDELLAEAAVEALLRCGVEREQILVLSNDPEDSSKRFGIEAVDRWRLGKVSRALARSETLLLGGGGLFQDATSLRSCVYYWGLVRMACLAGAVPWALGQSVGPLLTRRGRGLTRDALRLCRAVQVRDEPSRLLCGDLGVPVEVGHDLALSLDTPLDTPMGEGFAAKSAKTAGPRLVVNLRPGDMAKGFARAVAAYAHASALEIWGLAFSKEDEDLMRRLAQEGSLSFAGVERAAALADASIVLRGARVAAGMRLHFAILAARAQIPLVVAPYDPKVEAFAKDRRIPLWRDGLLPEPRASLFSSLNADCIRTDCVRKEIDALCRRVLGVMIGELNG
ncbi:MAG: polysaccharide pyruvyl transferase CsaB [Synergistaceae bacterium]|nr:polysaccharide pyruvyl transferase CsaB [Synergistaceae bacterium]